MVRILVAVVPFGLGGSPRLRDYVNVAVCDKAARVTCLYGTEPERRVSRLRRQYVRNVGALNVLVMQGRGVKYGILARLVRSIDVHRQPRAISHGDTDVALLDHRFVSTRFRGTNGQTMPLSFTIVKYNFLENFTVAYIRHSKRWRRRHFCDG